MRAPLDGGVRRFLLILLLLYLGFVIYGSLVPLNYQPMPLDAAWARFLNTPFLALGIDSRADWVANLLLFIPLAFFLVQVLAEGRGPVSRLAICATVLVLCAALAVSIEFVQLFFPPRTVSQNDILAESLGALVGIALHAAFGKAVIAWLAGWWQAERGRAVATRALHGYLVVMIAFSVMPLDLTISPVELAHKFNAGRVNLVPFADFPADAIQGLYKLATDILLWLPVGFLWRLGGASSRRVALRGVLLAGLIECMQLFVFSRFSNITDVIVGGIGCYLGACLVHSMNINKSSSESAQETPLWTPPQLPWLPICAVWAVLTVAAFWYPFNFDTNADFLSLRIAGLGRVPFETYYRGTEFRAINELFRKILMFLPGGLLWAAYVVRGEVWERHPRIWLGSTLAVLMALTVEGGQLFLPDKVSDFTDAFLASSGAWLGLALGLRLMSAARVIRKPVSSRVTAAHAAPPSHIAVSTSVPLSLWVFDIIAIGILATALFVGSHLNGVPYNLRELFPAGLAGAGAALGLALACWWLFAAPLVLLECWRKRPEKAMWLLAILPVMSAIGALLLVPAVPDESLFDIVGSPVLDWPAYWEVVGRYMALHAVMALAVSGAIWLVARLCWRHVRYLLPRWLIAVAVWAVPLHWIVVSAAATDNLTELMLDGGGPLASIYLFSGLVAFFTAASAFAAALVVTARRARLLVTMFLAWPMAAGLLWLGSEQALFKYGKLFSAAQFLLSASRDHYASGISLWLRFVAASIAVFILMALLQAAHWRRLAAQKP
ncbi:MAG: hypothetical protein JWL63_1509 [Rhodocyclales bacterium]|nr:hypothetical protein [Rhodocyclales bacterium]